MILDLSSILNVSDKSVSFSETISNNDFEYDRSLCEIVSPVSVSGTVTNIGGGAFKLLLFFETQIRVNCARCTKDIIRGCAFEVLEELYTNAENDDNVKFSENSFDITNLLSSAFMSNVLYKYLCQEDCKGLCPTCGVDLNTGTCNCTNDDIDPRFEVLKKLLENK